MRTGPQVTREHLESGSITGEGIRVRQQQLEPISTAPDIVKCSELSIIHSIISPGAGSLHIAVLVRGSHWLGRSIPWGVSGGSNTGVTVIFTGLDVSNIVS